MYAVTVSYITQEQSYIVVSTKNKSSNFTNFFQRLSLEKTQSKFNTVLGCVQPVLKALWVGKSNV